jgi:hypothetical protein
MVSVRQTGTTITWAYFAGRIRTPRKVSSCFPTACLAHAAATSVTSAGVRQPSDRQLDWLNHFGGDSHQVDPEGFRRVDRHFGGDRRREARATPELR